MKTKLFLFFIFCYFLCSLINVQAQIQVKVVGMMEPAIISEMVNITIQKEGGIGIFKKMMIFRRGKIKNMVDFNLPESGNYTYSIRAFPKVSGAPTARGFGHGRIFVPQGGEVFGLKRQAQKSPWSKIVTIQYFLVPLNINPGQIPGEGPGPVPYEEDDDDDDDY